jgi:ABC-type phosphate transport system substrate-binding protein
MHKQSIISLLTLLAMGLTSLFVQTSGLTAEKTTIAVIVADDSVTKTMTLSELKLIFWRKKNYWANGQRIHPINLPSDHALRLQFSSNVLGTLPSAQHDYWNGLYFHGISPPHVVHSDEAAIRYVQETTGTIAYVDACKVDARVKPIFWIMPNGDTGNQIPDIHCD